MWDKYKKFNGTQLSNLSSRQNEPWFELNLYKPVMACHESEEGKEYYCVGWLNNQLGVGNNIVMRLKMLEYDLSGMRVIGEQHEKFEDTIK